MPARMLESYADAWVRRDVAAAVGLLAPHVEITECYGPVYHGVDRFRQWFTTWFDAGGIVHTWVASRSWSGPGFEVAEWVFECTWEGERSTFEGCSVAEVAAERIVRLREYSTSDPLYEWTGEWR